MYNLLTHIPVARRQQNKVKVNLPVFAVIQNLHLTL
jgi:hypothetical protein